MFRKAAKLRNEMLAEGFTDNGGAIHSAERILNLLGLRLNYPTLNHGNNLRLYPGAEFSIEALDVHKAGGKVLRRQPPGSRLSVGSFPFSGGRTGTEPLPPPFCVSFSRELD
jgi:hypothetical protein